MKRQALALLLILLIIVSTTAIVEIVSSASSSGWVEVYSFSGGFLIDNNAAFSTASFEVSHFEFRVRWSIDPDEVSENWYGSDFSFSVVHGARSTMETLGTVSGALYSKTRNGTLIVQNTEHRGFRIEYNTPPLAKLDFIVEENINSPLLDIVPPVISIFSPENKTYDTENVTFAFSVNEATDYVNCFLDESLAGTYYDDTLVSVNQTLYGLSEGTHTVRVHAVDEAGNRMDETVTFSIDVSEPSPETEPPLIPTAWIVTAAVMLTVTGIILLVYFKKRKH